MSELIKLNDGGTAIINNSLFPQKNDYFFRNSKAFSNKHRANTYSINMYVDRYLKKHYSSEMIENMTKVKQYSNIIEEEKRVYSDSFLNSINELLLKLGENQPEIFPSLSGEVELDFGNKKSRVTVIIKPEGYMSIIRCDSGKKPFYIEKCTKYDEDYLQRIANKK